MSLFGSMKTSVSGMNAQANRLSTIADNVANASTAGYKKASVSFSSMVPPSSSGNYNSGGVQTTIRRAVSEQGDISYVTSKTDLSISGAGFFVVRDAAGTPYLTRDGSFQKDANGDLVNSSGFGLLGYPYGSGKPSVVVNGFGGLVPVNLGDTAMSATPTTSGTFDVNLPSNATATPSLLLDVPPSENSPYSFYTEKSRIAADDAAGNPTTTDIYYTKTAPNTWEMTVFADKSGTATGFPYDLTSGNVTKGTTTLTFDPTSGALVSGNPKVFPDPSSPQYYDFSGFTQQQTLGASDGASWQFNFPSDASAINTAGGQLPASSNTASSSYTLKKSVSGYVGNGETATIDLYMTKTGPDTWDVAAFNAADATAGGFPYGASGSAPLGTATFSFDPTTGALLSSPAMNVTLPNGDAWPVNFAGSVSLPASSSGNENGALGSLNLDPNEPILQPRLWGSTPSSQTAFAHIHFEAVKWSGASMRLGGRWAG